MWNGTSYSMANLASDLNLNVDKFKPNSECHGVIVRLRGSGAERRAVSQHTGSLANDGRICLRGCLCWWWWLWSGGLLESGHSGPVWCGFDYFDHSSYHESTTKFDSSSHDITCMPHHIARQG